MMSTYEDAAFDTVLGILIAYLVILSVYTVGNLFPVSWRRNIHIPIPAIIMLTGMAVHSIAVHCKPVPYATAAVFQLSSISPSIMSDVFLPAQIMTSALSLKRYNLQSIISKALILAIFGTYINIVLIAVAAKYWFPFDWNWAESCLLASILAVIDPLQSSLQIGGAPPDLRSMITMEAVYNHGFAYVLYQIFYRWSVQGWSWNWATEFYFKATFGSIALAMVFAFVLTVWVVAVSQDKIVPPASTLTASYGLWYLTNNVVEMSGAMAVSTFSILFTIFGRYWMANSGRERFDQIWSFVKWTAINMIFFIVGLLIASQFEEINKEDYEAVKAIYLVYSLLMWVCLLFFRFVIIILFYPLLGLGSYKVSKLDAFVLMWSSTRGSLALNWALTVHISIDVENQDYRNVQFFLVGMAVIFSIFFQGSTLPFFLRVLGYLEVPVGKRMTIEQLSKLFDQETENIIEEDKEKDAHLKYFSIEPDFDALKARTEIHLIEIFNGRFEKFRMPCIRLRCRRKTRHGKSNRSDTSHDERNVDIQKEHFLETFRRIFLVAVIMHYKECFESQGIDPVGMRKLVVSSLKAIENANVELTDWRRLSILLPKEPRIAGSGSRIRLLQKMASVRHHCTVGRRYLTYATFACAHAAVRRQIREWICRSSLQLSSISSADKTATSDMVFIGKAKGNSYKENLDCFPRVETLRAQTNSLRKFSVNGVIGSLLGDRATLMSFPADWEYLIDIVLQESVHEQLQAEKCLLELKTKSPHRIKKSQTLIESILVLQAEYNTIKILCEQRLLEQRECRQAISNIEECLGNIRWRRFLGN